MATIASPSTINDLERLVDGTERYDLIQGELRSMSPAGGTHGKIANRAGRFFGDFVDEHELGTVYGAETGFILARDPDTVLAPDMAFIQTSRLPNPDDEEGFVPVVPDLVLEIVSPSDRMNDVTDKVLAYLKAGVRMVLILQPRHRLLTVHRPGHDPHLLHEPDTFDGDDVLPGFRLQVSALFG
mgnify:CR=1 FL=1